MKLSRLIISVFLLVVISCNQKMDDVEKWKKEITDTELAFSAMAKTEGISKAFITYAAEDAVLLRNNKLIKGKEKLKANYEGNSALQKASLTWAPDFVDVSSSGDLGYTYGRYVYTATDSVGNIQTNEGIFHTVWKRQADGSWKFVWD